MVMLDVCPELEIPLHVDVTVKDPELVVPATHRNIGAIIGLGLFIVVLLHAISTLARTTRLAVAIVRPRFICPPFSECPVVCRYPACGWINGYFARAGSS